MVAPTFLKPRNFRPSDLVIEAEFARGPAFASGKRCGNNKAASRGLAYEKRVHQHFASFFCPEAGDVLYQRAPWIRFRTSDPRETQDRWAEPDGLLFNLSLGLITIIEIKLAHTQNAWWGLRRLYEPLIRKIFGSRWAYAVCEVCEYYDPATNFPEPFDLCYNISDLRRNEFGVMLLTPRKLRASQTVSAAFPDFR